MNSLLETRSFFLGRIAVRTAIYRSKFMASGLTLVKQTYTPYPMFIVASQA